MSEHEPADLSLEASKLMDALLSSRNDEFTAGQRAAAALRAAAVEQSQVRAVRTSYAEFQSTGDVHELARSVGNILDAGGD